MTTANWFELGFKALEALAIVVIIIRLVRVEKIVRGIMLGWKRGR